MRQCADDGPWNSGGGAARDHRDRPAGLLRAPARPRGRAAGQLPGARACRVPRTLEASRPRRRDGTRPDVTVDGRPAGNIVAWWQDGQRYVGYWFGREFWGRGVGTRA